jgi:chorismate dehydratase
MVLGVPWPAKTLRVGSVSYLNAKPLIHGLDRHPGIEMLLDVPARLLDGLGSGRFDVALLPVIDYQKLGGLRVVPSGGIGCDGATLTVRIFSPRPMGAIESLACDVESHTSVALAQIILKQRWNVRPKIVDFNGVGKIPGDSAVLLIGDKVITDAPKLEHQLDLGEAWKELTEMPFVFAVWTAREGVELGDLPKWLTEAKESGLANLDEIVAEHAGGGGWPADLARRYLADHLKYDVGPVQLAAIELFHRLAHEHGLISPPRPLVLY